MVRPSPVAKFRTRVSNYVGPVKRLRPIERTANEMHQGPPPKVKAVEKPKQSSLTTVKQPSAPVKLSNSEKPEASKKPSTAPLQSTSGPAQSSIVAHKELDSLTAQVLDDELQKIMLKVMQNLAAPTKNKEESLVVEKIKNESMTQIINVLGLNITKRMLNVFNQFNLKVHFSNKPERKYLSEFLQRHKFVGFTRIPGVNNTFAARVKSIQNYEDLCFAENITCGSSKITITPCYKITKCPTTLKTEYALEEDDEDAKNNKNSDKLKKETSTNIETPTNDNNTNKNIEKDNKTQETNSNAKTVVKSKNDNDPVKSGVSNKTVGIKVPSQSANKQIKKTLPVNKINVEVKKTSPKNKDGNNVPQVQQKIVPKKAKGSTAEKKNPDTKSKSQTTPKKANNVKVPNKITGKTVQVSQNKKVIDRPKENNRRIDEDDNKELDDHEILALISGGVVLDEYLETDD